MRIRLEMEMDSDDFLKRVIIIPVWSPARQFHICSKFDDCRIRHDHRDSSLGGSRWSRHHNLPHKLTFLSKLGSSFDWATRRTDGWFLFRHQPSPAVSCVAPGGWEIRSTGERCDWCPLVPRAKPENDGYSSL